MSTPNTTDPNLPLVHARLGDIVTLPDGRQMTVRSRCTLPRTVGSISGFLVLGEFELILATPASKGDDLGLYLPSVEPTFNYSDSPRQHAEGAARYYSPHLPPTESTMGEILYRVVEVRGTIHPHLVLFRSNEPIFFVQTASLPPATVALTQMHYAAPEGPANLRQAWTPTTPAMLTQPPLTQTEESKSLYQRAVTGN